MMPSLTVRSPDAALATAVVTRNVGDFADCDVAIVDPWDGTHG